jgi:putative endonuclease
MNTENNQWFVYLLRCNDNSLYAGVTTDLKRRVKEHNNSTLGAKYTRVRRPVTLAYAEEAASRSDACQKEYKLRKLSKKVKEEKVHTFLNHTD